MDNRNTRVALLGNSHASAIKNGWEDLAGHNLPLAITFFARPNGRGGLDGLKFDAGALAPEDPALEEWFITTADLPRIVLNDYDCFWIYGFGPEHKLTCSMAEELSKGGFSKSLITACLNDFKETVAGRFKESPLFALAQLVRSVTDKPIYVSSKPLFGELHSAAQSGHITESAGSTAFWALTEAIANLFEQLEATYIRQPSETVISGCFTRKEMSLQDNKHMNALYGQAMIKRFSVTCQ